MDNLPVIVLDFETTGLSPQYGDRAIEIGAVLIENDGIADRFQSLMNPGFRISSFIEAYTGISNDMVETAPPCAEVMQQFAEFMGHYPLVAHNASFDRKFLDLELGLIGKSRNSDMACSMLAARRIYPDAPNHKLGTLVRYCGIHTDGTFHRALADAEMTGHLWLAMINEIKAGYGVTRVPFDLMQKIAGIARVQAPVFLAKVAAGQF
ncbi:DNA polymerase III PolC-type [bacterium BMS3Bbin14]|nr:3'-5' exonuclease [Pseudomonadota bacterium]GBE11731.1 DNA polymerase III PolC-type [bacterium BMS3Abin13]GBE52280.1 DNA polymerase III PolC-type [bacterium BMS3Bbin14]HDK43464.1 3'-5' exonuclease [Desulfobacteraceae bacterium]HDO30278.1 3'-5' exonuclease [Desulfobacteraceae bacterium]